jgi:hypothetical protein
LPKLFYYLWITENIKIKNIMESFNKVKNYLLELEYPITSENQAEGVLVIDRQENGIHNMLLVCADPILIMEQHLFDIKKEDASVYKSLLMKNQDIIHGAFCLDDSGKKVMFRDTLQLENLDKNELEGSLKSLELLLSEYSYKIIEFAK